MNGEVTRFKQSYAVFSTFASIGKFFEIVGAIALVIGITILFRDSLGGYSNQRYIYGGIGIIGGIGTTLFGLFLVVIAELGLIIAETEKNTRKTCSLLESWLVR